MKPIKWPDAATTNDDQFNVLRCYVEPLMQRNHVVDPITGLTPIEKRNAFIADLTAKGIPFEADDNFVTLAVRVETVGDQ